MALIYVRNLKLVRSHVIDSPVNPTPLFSVYQGDELKLDKATFEQAFAYIMDKWKHEIGTAIKHSDSNANLKLTTTIR
ncbi:Uncharacterised protein [Actinobacillus lignieresii]|uniref:hypothetical protein n=1 Tax=Actinobacillus lignieresii TaxID=720 RepID=UPI000E118445|nr:hypothetical protein [Actinobacillus lignieresii]SUT96162.1 Uncharacterised protein [Actinobacillus lignieresii]